MAASMRSVCACPSRPLHKAVLNMRKYLFFSKKINVTSLSKAYQTCVETTVVAARGQKGQPLLHAHPRVAWGCERTARTAFYSAYHAVLNTDRSSLFACKPYWLQRCAVICSRIRDRQNSSDKSESETSKVFTQRSWFSSQADSNTGKHSDRAGCRSENPEKKENIKTIPNLLTTIRMASAPLLGYMVVCESFGPALGLFTFAGITDLLDGYIARNFPNQTSALGSALDPLADKLLVTILTVALTSVGLIPLPLTGLIVFRDVFLIAGGFYIRYRSLPPPITVSRYFDISHATVNLAPTFISKMNTGLQLTLVAFSLAAPVFGFVDHIGLQTLWWMTGATTFLSGADYLWSWKKYVTLLEKDQREL